MITLNDITMGFTQRTLFKDVSLSIFPKEKIGLTGPNGGGKSTLFSIILGETETISGNVQIQKNINIGYLPQESKFSSTKTVMEEITGGDKRIRNLMDEKRKLEDTHKADSDRYGDVLHELEQLGIYELEHRSEKILAGLGFKDSDFYRPISELSGGWQMRTLLAKLLVFPYDLLLLDEPTNFLDLEATLWLKVFLARYQGAFVLISHDRIFLNDVTTYTIMLEGSHMTKVKGNFEFYQQQKESNLKTLEKRHKVVEKKRKQLERFTQRFHAQPNKAASVRNKRKMIERLENIELPQEFHSMGSFEFSQIKSSGYTVMHMEKINKSYGSNHLYRDFDFEIIRGQKICLVGPNGAGKSTLLKMLAGVLDFDSGTVRLGHQVERGYFSQARMDVLTPGQSAYDEVISSGVNGTPALKVRSLLGLFNFHGDDVFKQVKILSGGEKSRLILAKLLINPPNFMLLDEPTTHLDIDGVKALTTAFKKYDGTLVFISHDLFFIKEIADCIIDIHDGEAKIYPGGLDYYLEKKGYLEAEKKKQTPSKRRDAKSCVSTMKKGQNPKQKDNSSIHEIHNKHKQALKRIAAIKFEIKNLEKEQKELEMETYIKTRRLSASYESRDAQIIKELGQGLKAIQKRLREIETTIKELLEEKAGIDQGERGKQKR